MYGAVPRKPARGEGRKRSHQCHRQASCQDVWAALPCFSANVMDEEHIRWRKIVALLSYKYTVILHFHRFGYIASAPDAALAAAQGAALAPPVLRLAL